MNLALQIMKDVFEIVKCSHSLRNELQKFTQLYMTSNRHLLLVQESGTVYLVTLKSVNPLKFSGQKSQSELLETALVNFVKLTSTKLATCRLCSFICIYEYMYLRFSEHVCIYVCVLFSYVYISMYFLLLKLT